MPSAHVEEILANHRKSPRRVLELSSNLSDADLVDLTAAADTFAAVQVLRVKTSCDADWGSARFTALALRLSNLSALGISESPEFSDTGLRAVAERLTALTKLEIQNCIKVTDAAVTAIARHLTALTHLGFSLCADVTDVAVRAIAEHLTALTTLFLRQCKVTDVGAKAVAKSLPALTHLDLSGTQVTDVGVKAIANCLPALTHLQLIGTQVTDVGVKSVIDHLTALTHLWLVDCDKVTSLPNSIGRLSELAELFLCGTRLTTFPVALRDLPRLRYLDALNIPTLKLPEELTRNPTNPRAILDYYFRTTSEGKRTLNEAKLILVGNEAVGKTSLVNFLVHKKPCRDTAKTPGVEIVEGVDVTQWNVDKADTGDTPLKLNVWDFGGQQVLYETHQFFLTARSLYLIVLEARRENTNEQEGNLHTWLRSIRTRTVEPVPVIVVINKSEPPHDLRLDEAKLIHEFPNIRGFIRTSCRDPKKDKHGGRGIDKLRKTIVDVIRDDLPHVCDQFPVSYFNIKEQLAKTARRSFILNTQAYRRKCKTEGVTELHEQDNLLTLLDCIGVVVRYDDMTLLDPNWLTTAVYRVLTHDAVTASQGEFARAELGAFLAGLPTKDYPRERWTFIVEMMKRFGLSFELPGQPDRYLLPNQLPGVDPQPVWDDSDALRFRYEYRHTPPRGLLPRFIVQAHQHLVNPRVAWLSGVILEIQGCPVLVRMNRQERQAHVSVRGPKNRRRDALSVVREYFGFVHTLNRFEPTTDFTAQVPVEVPGKPNAAFDFEDLETYERNGADTIYYKGCDRKFSVRDLLAGVGPEPRPTGIPTGGNYYDHRTTNVNISGAATGVAIEGATIEADEIASTVEQVPPLAHGKRKRNHQPQ